MLAIDNLRLVLLADGGGVEPMRVVDPKTLHQLDAAKPARFQLARSLPPREALHEQLITPAKWGWVGLDLPQEVEAVLLLGTLGAKNDWHEDGIRKQKQDSFELFSDVRRILRRGARGSVIARSAITGATGPARGIGVLPGAHAWAAAGGQLGQWGVKNVAFEIVQAP